MNYLMNSAVIKRKEVMTSLQFYVVFTKADERISNGKTAYKMAQYMFLSDFAKRIRKCITSLLR